MDDSIQKKIARRKGEEPLEEHIDLVYSIIVFMTAKDQHARMITESVFLSLIENGYAKDDEFNSHFTNLVYAIEEHLLLYRARYSYTKIRDKRGISEDNGNKGLIPPVVHFDIFPALIFLLKHQQGYSYLEISRSLNISLCKIKEHITATKKVLYQYYFHE